MPHRPPLLPTALACASLLCAGCAGQWKEARRILRGDAPHPATQTTAAFVRPPAAAPTPLERQAYDEDTAFHLFQQLVTH